MFSMTKRGRESEKPPVGQSEACEPRRKKLIKCTPSLEVYRPSPSWIQACYDIVEIISEILRQTVGIKWRVIPQGSFVQKLQLLGSDLDLVLLDGTDSWRNLNRKRTADELEKVVRRLTRVQWEDTHSPLRISVVQKIYSARVPLVKLRVTVRKTGEQVMVDMCFGDPSRGLCDEFVSRAIQKSDSSTWCQNFLLSLKIWATKRGICETMNGGISCFAVVLLALYHYKLQRVEWESFFIFFQSLRAKPSLSVCIEKLKLLPRPWSGEHDFLHVSVPCRKDENAARCTRIKVWNDKIVPEIQRAINIIRTNQLQTCTDFNRVVDCLLNCPSNSAPAQRFHLSESEEDSCSSHSDSTSDIEVVAINSVDVRSDMSEDSDLCEIIESAKAKRVLEQQSKPIDLSKASVIECEECSYFSFNQSAMKQHVDRLHFKRVHIVR